MRAICEVVLHKTVVGEARDVATGRSVIRETKPDLVLLDLSLPDGTGFTLKAELTAELPAMRWVAVSSYDNMLTALRIKAAHFNGFIYKNLGGRECLCPGLGGDICRPAVFFAVLLAGAGCAARESAGV